MTVLVRALLSGAARLGVGALLLTRILLPPEVPLLILRVLNSPILLIFSNLSSVFAILESHRKGKTSVTF